MTYIVIKSNLGLTDWRPIYMKSSLPYIQGERFLARINECICDTQKPNTYQCKERRPCIREFLVIDEMTFSYIHDNGRHTKGVLCTKQGILQRYKYWKIVIVDDDKRTDVFVCKCTDVCIPKSPKNKLGDDYTKLQCCHCKSIVLRCSEGCVNKYRGE